MVRLHFLWVRTGDRKLVHSTPIMLYYTMYLLIHFYFRSTYYVLVMAFSCMTSFMLKYKCSVFIVHMQFDKQINLQLHHLHQKVSVVAFRYSHFSMHT